MSECATWNQDVRDCAPKKDQRPDWGKQADERQDTWVAIATALLSEVVEVATPVEQRFNEYAADWSAATAHISSVSDLTSDPNYRKIIDLGWDVVPFLLKDLRHKRRFWFPALYAITNVRPFDPSDAGNGRRMTDAWLAWGKRKGLI